MVEIPKDLKATYLQACAGQRVIFGPDTKTLIERIASLTEENARINAELNKGDSWAWIRAKFDRCGSRFKWWKPRTDELAGTRYEVMGWLHCLFSDADVQVYIDIAMEHQKKAEEAEQENARLKEKLRKIEYKELMAVADDQSRSEHDRTFAYEAAQFLIAHKET